MAIIRGTTATWRIPLFGPNDQPLDLSGCTLTSTCRDSAGGILFVNMIDLDATGAVISATNMSLETTVAAGVVIEQIPSEQTATFPAGTYVTSVQVELADGSDYEPLSAEVVEVIDPSVPDVETARHGISRREIRRTVARMLSDYHEATDAVGGTTNAFHDPRGLARENNYFKGMQVLFSNPVSPHYNTVATVTQSDGPTRTIYFEPPLAVPSIPGDTVELYNFRGRGTLIGQYNGAINDAISQARQQHVLLPHTETVSGLFSRQFPEIVIPSIFVSFSRVEATLRNGQTYRIKPSEYRVDRMSRTVEVWRFQSREHLHGLALRLVGYVSPGLLENDDDRTTMDVEWLYNEVKAQLLERMVASGMPVTGQDRLFLQERNEASGKRAMIINRAMPNTIRLF